MRLHDYLDHWAGERPDGEFAVADRRRMSYAEAQAGANRLAHAFIAAGLAPGARCAVLARNSIEYALLYLAASKAGVVLVPLNYRCAQAEWRHVIADSGAEMVIIGREYMSDVDTLRNGLPLVRHWAALHALADGQQATPPERPVDADAALYQLYTSGTTGTPKVPCSPTAR